MAAVQETPTIPEQWRPGRMSALRQQVHRFCVSGDATTADEIAILVERYAERLRNPLSKPGRTDESR